MVGFSTPTKKDALADWVEISVLFAGSGMSKAGLRDHLEEDGVYPDLEKYDEANLVDSDAVSAIDVIVDEAYEELRSRKDIGQGGYPFVLDGSHIAPEAASWRDSPGFALMACLNARYLFGLQAPINTGARLFERLVTHAARAFWSGNAVHFGWPRDGEGLAAFEDATRDLARLMGERVIRDVGEFPTAQKDAGLDAVTWRALDQRRGSAILLLQCAIGDDWDSKGVLVEVWRKFLSFAVPPMTGLAFPFVPESVRTHVDWEVLCGRIGIPLDRVRLAALLGESPSLPDDLAAAIVDYVGAALTA